MNMCNIHRMFIYIYIYIYIHRTLESRNTKNTFDFLVQVRNFLLPLSLKVLRHKERDTSFYADFSICLCPPSRAAPVAHKFVWPQRAPKVDTSRSESSSQLPDFFKTPKILRTRFRWTKSFPSTGQPFYLGFLFWYLWTTHPPHARVNTRTQVCS